MRLPEGLGSMIFAGFVGAILGIIGMFYFDFAVGKGTAEEMIADAHTEGVVSITAPICFERAQNDPEEVALVLDAYSSSQPSKVIAFGWLDEEWPSQRDIAAECARLLREAQAAS